MQIYSAYSVMSQTVKRRPGLHTLKASRFFVEREKKKKHEVALHEKESVDLKLNHSQPF